MLRAMEFHDMVKDRERGVERNEIAKENKREKNDYNIVYNEKHIKPKSTDVNHK